MPCRDLKSSVTMCRTCRSVSPSSRSRAAVTLIEVGCSLVILAVAGTYLARLVVTQHDLRRKADLRLATELKLENVAERLKGIEFDRLESEVMRLERLYHPENIDLRIETFDTDVGPGLHVVVSTKLPGSNAATVSEHRWRIADERLQPN